MKFIQFLRPDGRQQEIEIERSPEIEALAKKIILEGLHLEIEELSTGDVSMTVASEEEDLFIRVCQNGPEVPKNVDSLIKEASAK